MTPFEVFYWATAQLAEGDYTPGWYWWYCHPGCLPDSEPCGPYRTEQEAYAAAREEAYDARQV
jgi:hypothetical protein